MAPVATSSNNEHPAQAGAGSAQPSEAADAIYASKGVSLSKQDAGAAAAAATTTPSKPHSLLPAASIPKILGTVRCLAADLVQQFNGGHPGTAMGAAAIGVALFASGIENGGMRYNPKDAQWINRDRFVLSAGHACLFQYIFLHLTSYRTWTLDMLKRYHSRDFIGSQAHGHPEIECEGIEVTTGPLGQGIANSVGLAIASKHLAARFNQPSSEAIVDNKVWCFTGDGCLQEGIGLEALSLAGHLRLDNLIVLYDNNAITVDGGLDICFTQDMSATLRAMGWRVLEVLEDASGKTSSPGTHDVAAITDALKDARENGEKEGKPTFINIRTIIGYGSEAQGTHPTHGAALGEQDVRRVKQQHGRDPEAKFVVEDDVYDAFKPVTAAGQRAQEAWEQKFQAYASAHPELAKEFKDRFLTPGAQLPLPSGVDVNSLLPSKAELPSSPIATRKASGIVMDRLGPACPALMAGSADLMDSTFVRFPGQVDFQHPSTGLGDYTGRQIRYGIREHSMAAIANGLAAYHPNAVLPVISTFFMFFLYAAPAIRMAALQHLRVIGIATHDSITIGEDGPTHQPIALASLFRAMPNLNFIRPADVEEVMGAWQLALSEQMATRPTILSLSRQNVPHLPGSSRDKVARGGYVVFSTDEARAAEPTLVLVSSGGDVWSCVEAAKLLAAAHENVNVNGARGISINVVSLPSMKLFSEQPDEYRREVLPLHRALVVGVEAWASHGWARFCHAVLCMSSFGLSGPQADLLQHFGLDKNGIAKRVGAYLQQHLTQDGQVRLPAWGDFQELPL